MNKVARVIFNELVPRSPVFSTADVTRRTGVSLANASRDLRNLEAHGVVARLRRGLWAVSNHPDFSPYAVVPHLFAERERGYVSLLSALSLHGMMEQIPQEVHLVTTSQRPALRTPVATYAFHRIERNLFGGFRPYRRTGNFEIATPEKALFDTLYFSARKGRRFAFLPEVELSAGFSQAEVERWIDQISHSPLRTAVKLRWEGLASRISPGTRPRAKRTAIPSWA
jgi:predicted transcriptional regulator of viral defense system